MRIGTVTGAVWATRKAERLRGPALLIVTLNGGKLVAADLVGAGPGDRVLLTFGSAARQDFPEAPIDAAIVAILDGTEDTYVST